MVMKLDRLNEILAQFDSRRIAVVGDFFLDKYMEIDPTLVENSVETGLNAHQVTKIRTSPGAAGTVVNNLMSLGLKTCDAIGAIGDDGEGHDLKRDLVSLGCWVEGLLSFKELMTPTYLKPRDQNISGLKGEWDRFDTKNRLPAPEWIIDLVAAQVNRVINRVDAVVIADQVEEDNCGVISEKLRDRLSQEALEHPKVIFWADSRTHIMKFKHMMIKPNQFEAVEESFPDPGAVVDHGRLYEAIVKLKSQMNAPVCITLGEQGMLTSDPDVTHIPTVKVDGPTDTTGAGDSVTAAMVLALSAGATLVEAALIGNMVASITIQQLSTTGTATREKVIEQFHIWQEQHSDV